MSNQVEGQSVSPNDAKPVLAVVYSDGKDYSHMEVNSFNFPEHEECVWCGSTEVTITDEADICHSCGYVYT